MKILKHKGAAIGAAVIAATMLSVGTTVVADTDTAGQSEPLVATGLLLPQMDSENGRALFASKGCVVCHSVNGVGGVDAPMLDAEFMDQPMDPFAFAANMWRGAETMVAMQREELGDVIEMSGQELADIIAFVHDPAQQAKFSEADIPEDIQELMEHAEEEEEDAPHD